MPARNRKTGQRRIDDVFARANAIGKDFGAFTEAFYNRHVGDDEMAYEPEALVESARIAWAAIESYRPGKSYVDVKPTSPVMREGKPVAVVTVINENMPFLLDSVLGEVTDAFSEVHFVRHPVIRV